MNRFYLSVALGLLTCGTAMAQEAPRNPGAFAESLKRPRNAEELANGVRKWFGADNLKKGPGPKVSNTEAAWAIEIPNVTSKAGEPRIISEDNSLTLPLKRIGKTDVFASAVKLPEGAAFRWAYEADGKKIGEWRNLEVYTDPVEFTPNPNAPHGATTAMPKFRSKVFEGTSRDWWVYIPAQVKEKPDVPAALMVFQDGQWEKDSIPVALDNLISKGDIPPMVAVFITPGTFDNGGSNRSVEYDTLSPKFSQFLIEEIIPEVNKLAKIRTDAAGRGISGISSGGICAFTVAWERPDQFHKVLSGVGSFTNLQGGANSISGGHNYPFLIRNEIGWDKKGKNRPIRVFLSDGKNDLDNKAGNWPLANQQMAKALEFGSYDYKFVFGNGFHSGAFHHALFPDAMRWLWRDEVKK
jgi:enterochelin esterase family protein